MKKALAVAMTFEPELILLDLVMPQMDGRETCRALKTFPQLADTKIIMLSARQELDDRLTSYEAGAVDYIVKPFYDQEVLAKVRTWMNVGRNREVGRIWSDLEEIRDGIGRTLASLVELRDTETGEHLFRMRWYSQILAEQLALDGPYRAEVDDTFQRRLYRAAPLHDIGKIGISDEILRKPGWLTAEEFEAMKRHTTIGADLLQRAARNLPYADYLPMAVKVARHHHERFDGSGYPDGLVGTDIPLSARIVAVADVFDAITSDRVYREAMSLEQSLAIIKQGAGRHFDGVIVSAFETRVEDIKQGLARFQFLQEGTVSSLIGQEAGPVAEGRSNCTSLIANP
ncbi:MAG: HD domain-containing protein [Pirellulales bacterium]